MSDFHIISTETWRVRLPADWQEKKSSAEDSHYFESEDGSKGAYFATWLLSEKGNTAQGELETFRRHELKSLEKMKDRKWAVRDQWTAESAQVATTGLDCYDSEHSYRIICVLHGQLPWIVRASFHDYNCADYQESKLYFQPLIDSLEIHQDGG